MNLRLRRGLMPLVVLLFASPAFAQKEFGFDNRKGSGQEYLAADETVKRFKVAPEFEVKLFAAEPNCVNPIAFTIDEKGRVWVIECFEYPKRTPPGKAPRDRIVILEDTDGDGACDKRTVFAEGKDFPVTAERQKQGLGAFDLASGIEVGHGGVFVGAPPYLWFIEDKGGKPGKFEVLLKGFGSQDTHETLNTFQWGPDGWLYGLHGVFTQSNVQNAQLDGPELRMNAAVWRYHPKGKKFEVYAEGTSNPWGMDWRNTDGQFILACCVIPHLYHIVPGGIYRRQAGASYNPYAYGEIQEICDHTFHRESGWAHAGLIALDAPHIPRKYHNSVIFGSIHGCSIKQNVLKPNGSTFIASKGEDFLVSGDKNFRPINMKWGPNGDIYLIDWHDQNPCHQTKPDDWDYERGRVYRIQLKGTQTKKAEDLAARSPEELATLAISDDPYASRQALRLLAALPEEGRKKAFERLGAVGKGKAVLPLKVLWAGLALGMVRQEKVASFDPPAAGVKDLPADAAWALRVYAESGYATAKTIQGFATVAAGVASPTIRRELASAAVRLADQHDVTPLLHALMARKEDAQDRVIPHLLWYAYEKALLRGPTVREGPGAKALPHGRASDNRASDNRASDNRASDNRASDNRASDNRASHELAWLAKNAGGNPLIAEQIVPRVVRRLAATGRPEDLALCVKFAGALSDPVARRAALEGLALALKEQVVDAPAGWAEVQQKLLAMNDPAITELTNRLAVNFRDPAALQRAFETFRNKQASVEGRAEALRQLVRLRHKDAGRLVQIAIRQDESLKVRAEAARQLAAFEDPRIAEAVVADWKHFPKEIRPELVNSLASRREWAKILLRALADKRIDRAEVTDNVITRVQAFNDKELTALIEKGWGRTRPTPQELNQLIDRMRGELVAGPASFNRGKLVFQNQCAKCHKFDGSGAEVGPPLDGAGRDIEYILANVIDPNRVIGAPYFQRIVKTLDGRAEQGLLAEEDDRSIALKVEKGEVKRFLKADLDGPVQVLEKSMMPEGLTAGMTAQDFRDLVRYLMAHPFLTDVTVDGKPVSVGVPGRIPLPEGGESRVEATFTAADDLTTQLLLGGAAQFEVKLDGQVIGQGSGRRDEPDQLALDVVIPKGEHKLTITVKNKGTKSAFYARFRDPDRKLSYPDAGAKK